MRTPILLFSALVLTGCVSEKTAMVNQQGRVIHCDAWGFGWLGAPVAMAEHHDCVKKAQGAGYTVGGGPVPTSAPASAPSPAAGLKPVVALQQPATGAPTIQISPQAPAATESVAGVTQAAPASVTGSVAGRLKQLDDLYKSGLITKDEYERKRQQILSTL
jgi:hypothetical protein